ncbi:hypothetical protein [Gimesia maris]|uniref:hypothetical protein n=1 Tax=Gimesia maris TaxID=122 RepID=UPI0012B85E19|nr:hypothetical protein [Gimesia maris]
MRWNRIQNINRLPIELGEATKPISIDFDYDAKRNALSFRGQSYPVSTNQIAIIRFDATLKYKVDVVKMNDSIIAEVTSEMQ